MRIPRLLVSYLTLMAFVGLIGYEVSAKLPGPEIQGLAGCRVARMAEQHTPWRELSGVMPIDRVAHEFEEAARFYRLLLTGAPSSPLFTVLETSQ